MLAGHGGIGKSRFSLQLACGVALRKKDWLGENGPKIALDQGEKVVYVSWEQEQRELAFRLPKWAKENIKDLDGQLIFINPHESSLWSKGKKTNYLSYLLAQIEQAEAKLLILDPLAAAFIGNENDRSEVRAFLAELSRWAIKADCTVLIVAHPNKTGSDYSGSTDWVNACRAVWTVSRKIRDEQGRPKKRSGTSDKQLAAPDAVCLESIKSTYAKTPAEIWLKDEYRFGKQQNFIKRHGNK